MKKEKSRSAAAAHKVAQQPDRVPPRAPRLPSAGRDPARPRTPQASGPCLKIPALLFENDDPPRPPPVTGPGEKFLLVLAPPAAASAEKPDELPAAYGTGTLLLAAREPRGLYAHWDLTDDQQAHYLSQTPDRHLVLHIDQDPPTAQSTIEIHVLPEARHRFIEVPAAGTRYTAALGYYEPGGRWVRIAAAGPVSTPSESVSEDKAVRFATIAPMPEVVESAPSTTSALPSIRPVEVVDDVVPQGETRSGELLRSPQDRRQREPLSLALSPLGGERGATRAPASLVYPAALAVARGEPLAADVYPLASPTTEGYRTVLEPSLLPPPPEPETVAATPGAEPPPSAAEDAVGLDFPLVEDTVSDFEEWTPGRERALAELTGTATRGGQGSSYELLA